MLEQGSHWQSMAAQWREIGPPLRPGVADVAAFEYLIRQWNGWGITPPHVLLLGVTPELFHLPWPQETDFRAVEKNRNMIEAIWPGTSGLVTEADWRDLPLPSGSRDIALCDGGLHLLDSPEGQQRLVERLHEVLSPGGICIFRLFSLPQNREAPEAVLADLFEGRIADLNELKLRLCMAMQTSSHEGVRLGDVWQMLAKHTPSWESLAARLQWRIAHLRVIDTYRDSASRYCFLTDDEAVALFCEKGRFAFREKVAPESRLGGRCPIVMFERG